MELTCASCAGQLTKANPYATQKARQRYEIFRYLRRDKWKISESGEIILRFAGFWSLSVSFLHK